jgi:hypothetical protein
MTRPDATFDLVGPGLRPRRRPSGRRGLRMQSRSFAPRNPESGYALLFVYAMAASLAIMLYMQLPRVAFEAQRDKEQLLIDRGEQYKRAIQLYVRKYNRFPPDVDALEKTQNLRFLRKQYVDPMTGKNEWRVIHVGPGGVFTDSKVYGQQKKKDDASAPQSFITEMQAMGASSNNGQTVNLATRRRPSDDAGAPGDPNNPGNNSGQPGNPGPSGNISGPVMVLPDGRIVPATPNGQPLPNGQQQQAGGPQTGFPPGFQPPSGVGVQQGSNPFASGVPPQPGQPGFQSTPNTQNVPGAPPQSAANLINQILTTPRPGGLNGLNGNGTDPSTGTGGAAGVGGAFGGAANSPVLTGGTVGQVQPGMGGQAIGGGIGGFASKLEQEGIKTYNQKTSYDEWEFVYDISKDKSRGGGAGMGQIPAQQSGQQQQQPGQQQPGLQSTPFGSPGPNTSTGTGTTGTKN